MKITSNESGILETGSEKKLDFLLYLEKVKSFVEFALQEREEKKENKLFYDKVQQLINLAGSYMDYLKFHQSEFIDNELIKCIAHMAKGCLLLNLKIFKFNEENEKIIAYRKEHMDFDQLNYENLFNTDDLDKIPLEKWTGIKEFLYNHKYNNEREQLREKILQRAQTDIDQDKFDSSQVDHLERFLPPLKNEDGTDKSKNESILLYVQQNAESIKKWISLKMDNYEFQKYILNLINEYNGDLAIHPILRQIDEEMASIKQNDLIRANIKASFVDRSMKIKWLRALRFGRVIKDHIQSKIKIWESDPVNDKDIKKKLGPLLRQNLKPVIDLLSQTTELDHEKRLIKITELLENIPQLDREKIIKIIFPDSSIVLKKKK